VSTLSSTSADADRDNLRDRVEIPEVVAVTDHGDAGVRAAVSISTRRFHSLAAELAVE